MSNASIRPMTDSDLVMVLAWRNHPEVRRYMYSQHEIALDEHRNWFELSSRNPSRHLLIFELDSLPQGFVNLNRLNDGGISDWGFYLAPDAPKGCGHLLGSVALQYAFSILKLHKVCGQVLAYNERSTALHRRLGFQQEGALRDQHFDGEQYHSIVFFGLLECEWAALQRR